MIAPACIAFGLPRAVAADAPADEPPVSFCEEEIARFTRLADDPNPAVRLQVVKALGVCGTRKAVDALVDALDDADWEVRENARDALARMTAAGPFADRETALAWQRESSWSEKEAALVEQLESEDPKQALAALEALRFVGSSASEDAVLKPRPKLGGAGLRLTVRTLERIGTEKSVPGLTALAKNVPSASWALVELAGPAAEPALLEALPRWRASRLDYLVNLDRVGSTNCGPHLPILLQAFGLVIFRSRTDDLQFQPTAYQRAAGNLILRTGRAQEVVDLILAECEGTRREEDTPPELRVTLANMKPELGPGFVRGDGMTVAQPLAALPHIITDRRFIPRLIALLDHPAYIVRIYAAEGLAALEAEEGVEPILNVLRTPYPFPDPTSQVSGKHFDKSRFVRWRGYVAIALGKLGGEAARLGLEALAANPASYRDIRYGSVVGLRFLGSPKSVPVLEQVAAEDIIREVRMEALAAVEEIRLAEQLTSAPLAGK